MLPRDMFLYFDENPKNPNPELFLDQEMKSSEAQAEALALRTTYFESINQIMNTDQSTPRDS
jgi:hypothetical protein